MVSVAATSSITDFNIGSVGSKDRVLDFYSDFRGEMANLMGVLTDPEADLELNGFKLDAENKNGAAGSYLINEWLSEQEFIFSQLLESYKFEQTLENKINNFSFS